MKLLEMGKDMKIKYTVSSRPTKYGQTFFVKKLCIGGTNFFGQIYRGMFYMGTNDQIVQGESLWLLRSFKDRVKLVFLSLTLTRVVDILFEKLTPQIGD